MTNSIQLDQLAAVDGNGTGKMTVSKMEVETSDISTGKKPLPDNQLPEIPATENCLSGSLTAIESREPIFAAKNQKNRR